MAAPDDFADGHYVVTYTVYSNRRNIFYSAPGKERHIATLVGGSRTRLAEFDADCERIVRALAQYDAMKGFVRQMATMSLPEEEATGDVDEYIADLDEERLFGEYSTFMDMVRSVREIMK